jgi:hypothetical protein
VTFKLLIFHTFDGVALVLDGDDDGRQFIESIGDNNLEQYPDDFGIYGEQSGLYVVTVQYEDPENEDDEQEYDNLIDSKVRRLNSTEVARLAAGRDVLMNV